MIMEAFFLGDIFCDFYWIDFVYIHQNIINDDLGSTQVKYIKWMFVQKHGLYILLWPQDKIKHKNVVYLFKTKHLE